MERESEEICLAVASTGATSDDAEIVDQSNQETTRLRSALFGAADANAAAESEPSDRLRLLARSDRPVRKRTPSELGHPNGKRSLGIGR